MTAMATVAPFARELLETRHQFERPYVLDPSLTEMTFGLTSTQRRRRKAEVDSVNLGRTDGR